MKELTDEQIRIMREKDEHRKNAALQIVELLHKEGFTYKESYAVLSKARSHLEDASLRNPV